MNQALTQTLDLPRTRDFVEAFNEMPERDLHMGSIRPGFEGCFIYDCKIALDRLGIPCFEDRYIFAGEAFRVGSYLLGEEMGEEHYRDFIKGFMCANPLTFLHDFAQWAENNPDIWGNEYGRFVFSSPAAFRSSRATHKGTWSGGVISSGYVKEHLNHVVKRLEHAA